MGTESLDTRERMRDFGIHHREGNADSFNTLRESICWGERFGYDLSEAHHIEMLGTEN